MKIYHPVGEEEVIELNMALAQEKNYTVEDLLEFPEVKVRISDWVQ